MMPDAADENSIEAKYADGVLRVDISKREEAKILSCLWAALLFHFINCSVMEASYEISLNLIKREN